MSKKNHESTAAQRLFEGKQLLTARPEGMEFKEYKILRAHQTLLLQRLFGNPSPKPKWKK